MSLDDLLYRCTVRVDVGGKKKGTGFFVAPGMVLTCAHVVEDVTGQPTAQPIEVYWHWGRQHHSVHIQNGDFLPRPYPDLALLRTSEPLEHPCVYLDRYSDIQLDDKLYSYGYTEAYPNGESAEFSYEGPSHDPDLLKLKGGQASPGMSGAPLLDQRVGAVCGLLKRSRDTHSDLGGRAVPASTILSQFAQLRALQEEFHAQNSAWMLLRPRSVTTGNITVTDYPSNGAEANITSPQGHVLMRSHVGPASLLPRAETGFLNRTREVEATTAVLQGGSPAEFHGPAGVGKTAILHQLSNQEFAKPFPDGIVFFRARQKPLEDLLLELFKAFYDLEPAYKPTSIEIRSHLQSKHALIILDDVDLDRDQVGELMDAVPDCTFLLASTKRRLWGRGRAVALRGLPSEDGVSLIERELEHVLSTEERSLAAQLCTALGGYPQSLLEVAGLMRDEGVSLVDVAEQMSRHAGSAAEAITEYVVVALDESEKRLCAALASLGGASVGEEHLDKLAGVENPQPTLESLQRRHLVQKHSPRYSLVGSLNETLQETWDLAPWNTRTLGHFAAWAEEQRDTPRRILEESDAVLKILERAVQQGNWESALRLGRAVESAFILSGRWGAWAQILVWQLEAARALGDNVAIAWALHQSGTRALCLEGAPGARTALTEALRLRESLGDDKGAAITRHNLRLLDGLSGDARSRPNGNGRRWPRWLWPGIIAFVLVLLFLGATALSAERAGNGILPDVSDFSLPFFGGDDSAGSGGGGRNGGDDGKGPHDGKGPSGGNNHGGPALTVSGDSLHFGDQEVDTTSEPRTVALISTGEEPVEIDALTLTGSHQRDFVAIDRDVCAGIRLDSNQRCTMSVTFTPSETGTRSARLRITDSSASSPSRLPLSGNGTEKATGALVCSPEALIFGTYEVNSTSAKQEVTCTNVSSESLDITAIETSGDFDSNYHCDLSLAPRASCTVTVSFTPTSVGLRPGTMTVTYSAAGSPATISLSGTGIPSGVPVASITPPSWIIALPPGTQYMQPFTLRNLGSAPLNIRWIKVSAPPFSQINNCDSNLEPSESCSISVTFAPTKVGKSVARLRINHDDPDGVRNVLLRGIATGQYAVE